MKTFDEWRKAHGFEGEDEELDALYYFADVAVVLEPGEVVARLIECPVCGNYNACDRAQCERCNGSGHVYAIEGEKS